ALVPRGAVGLDLTQGGIGCHQRAGRLVRVIVLAAEAAQACTADAALAGAVDSGEDVQARRPDAHRAAAVARAAALAALARGLDRGPAELRRGSVERRLHALSRLGRLHAVEKRIEFRAEIVQVLILPF